MVSHLPQAPLIDDEGELSAKFEAALVRIFARFSSSYRSGHSATESTLPTPNKQDVLTEDELDQFAAATNGSALSKESKDEIREFLDTDDNGNLTFRGFYEMFHLQSDNDPEETWRDLGKLGFDDQLEYHSPPDSVTDTSTGEGTVTAAKPTLTQKLSP